MARAPRSDLKKFVSEPIYVLEYESEDDAAEALLRRMQRLFQIFKIEHSESGYEKLAWCLAEAMLPGFRVRSMRSAKTKRKREGGHPKLDIDLPKLIVAIDRRIDEEKAKGKKIFATTICNQLVKTQAYKRFKSEQLSNQYNKHNSTTRNSVIYLSLYPEHACARTDNRCFALADFEDCDLADAPYLCKQPLGCHYFERTAGLIKSASRRASQFKRLDADIQSLAIQLKKSSAAAKRVRRLAMALSFTRLRTSK